MVRANLPELKKYMEKRLVLQLNGNRKINGILRGFDPFMNIVLDDTKDEATDTLLGLIVVRGNSVQMIEALDLIA